MSCAKVDSSSLTPVSPSRLSLARISFLRLSHGEDESSEGWEEFASVLLCLFCGHVEVFNS